MNIAKLYALPTAQERAQRELRYAELEVLQAAAQLEHWQAQRAMLEGRVARLRSFLGAQLPQQSNLDL